MRHLIIVLLVLAAQPSWALYKCSGNGSVSFQEQPCKASETQSEIETLASPPAAPALPDTGRPSLQQQLDTAEADRLRRDAGYDLRDKKVQLANHQHACDAQQRAILSNRTRANNNLAGAMYEQSVATEANAAATRCDTRARELQAEVDEAGRLCTARRCN